MSPQFTDRAINAGRRQSAGLTEATGSFTFLVMVKWATFKNIYPKKRAKDFHTEIEDILV